MNVKITKTTSKVPGEFVAKLTHAVTKSEHFSVKGFTADILRRVRIATDKHIPLHEEHKRHDKPFGAVHDAWFNEDDEWMYIKGQLDLNDTRGKRIHEKLQRGEEVCMSIAFRHPKRDEIKNDLEWYNTFEEASFVQNPLEKGASVIACHSEKSHSEELVYFNTNIIMDNKQQQQQDAMPAASNGGGGGGMSQQVLQNAANQLRTGATGGITDASAKHAGMAMGLDPRTIPGTQQLINSNLQTVDNNTDVARILHAGSPDEQRQLVINSLQQMKTQQEMIEKQNQQISDLNGKMTQVNQEFEMAQKPLVEGVATQVRQFDNWTEQDINSVIAQTGEMAKLREFGLPLTFIRDCLKLIDSQGREISTYKQYHSEVNFALQAPPPRSMSAPQQQQPPQQQQQHRPTAVIPPQQQQQQHPNSLGAGQWSAGNHPLTSGNNQSQLQITSHSADDNNMYAVATTGNNFFNADMLKKLRQIQADNYQCTMTESEAATPHIKRRAKAMLGRPDKMDAPEDY